MSSVQCIPGLCVQLSLQPMVHACTEHVQALSQNMQEQHDAAATPPLSFHHIAARMHVLGFQPPPAALSKGGVWLLCCLGCILHCTTPDQCTYHTPQQLYFRLSVQVHRQLSWVTEVHGSPSSRQQHPPPDTHVQAGRCRMQLLMLICCSTVAQALSSLKQSSCCTAVRARHIQLPS